MDLLAKDKRFSHIKNDPRFYNMPRKEQKLKIDKRFEVNEIILHKIKKINNFSQF